MFTIYSKEQCNYCTQSKRVLEHKKIPFEVKMLGVDYDETFLKENFPTNKSFPVILKDGVFIGGFNELRQHI